MNYIAEIKAFYDWLETNLLPPPAINMWHALMHIANKTGWQPKFAVAISVLEVKTGLKKQVVQSARNALRQAGRIEFESRSGNQSAVYKIISLVANRQPQIDTQTHLINKLNKTKRNDLSSFCDLLVHSREGEDEYKNILINITKEFAVAYGYPPNQTQIDMLLSFVQEGMTEELLFEALKRSAEAGANRPSYTKAILQSWLNKGALTKKDVDRLDGRKDSDRKVSSEDFTYSGPEQNVSFNEFFGISDEEEADLP